MPFCPTCQTEYETQKEFCIVCKGPLVDSPATEDLQDDIAGTELVELAEFSNVAEAELVRELLEENGIQIIQRGESDPIGIASGAEPVSLLVEKRQLSRARELYDAYFAGNDTAAPQEEE